MHVFDIESTELKIVAFSDYFFFLKIASVRILYGLKIFS